MPKVSVILPVYNVEKYLKQCLESLCRQTLSDIEIICVDDGSTDGSLPILQSFEKQDERIRVISQKNQYAGVARNNGMKYAAGKYLLFLDSDDFFELDMVEKLYQRAEEDQLDVALCHYFHYDDRSGEKIEIDFRKEDLLFPKGMKVFSGQEIKYAGIFQATVGWAWDKLFRTDFVKEMGYEFPDFRSSEDGYFVYMLMARAERIGVLEDRLVWHRMNNGSSLSSTREQNWENGFRMVDLIYEELKRQNIYEKYEQSFVSWVVAFEVWYLTTLYKKDAFCKAYRYIQEQKFNISQYQGEFICAPKFVEHYKLIRKVNHEQFLLQILKDRDDTISKNQSKGWVFPYGKIPKSARLIIYGAGVVGRSYYEQLQATGYCREIHIVDRDHQKVNAIDYPVESIEAIKNLDFDYVLVAISDYFIKESVRKLLIDEYGVSPAKIV